MPGARRNQAPLSADITPTDGKPLKSWPIRLKIRSTRLYTLCSGPIVLVGGGWWLVVVVVVLFWGHFENHHRDRSKIMKNDENLEVPRGKRKFARDSESLCGSRTFRARPEQSLITSRGTRKGLCGSETFRAGLEQTSRGTRKSLCGSETFRAGLTE